MNDAQEVNDFDHEHYLVFRRNGYNGSLQDGITTHFYAFPNGYGMKIWEGPKGCVLALRTADDWGVLAHRELSVDLVTRCHKDDVAEHLYQAYHLPPLNEPLHGAVRNEDLPSSDL